MTTNARLDAGPLCECGHGFYEHYLCGDKAWCYGRRQCGCEQFIDPRYAQRKTPRIVPAQDTTK